MTSHGRGATRATSALQCVRVLTRRGWVVLASDASHFYENVRERKLFPIVLDAEVMLKGFERLEELADSPDHIVPARMWRTTVFQPLFQSPLRYANQSSIFTNRQHFRNFKIACLFL